MSIFPCFANKTIKFQWSIQLNMPEIQDEQHISITHTWMYYLHLYADAENTENMKFLFAVIIKMAEPIYAITNLFELFFLFIYDRYFLKFFFTIISHRFEVWNLNFRIKFSDMIMLNDFKIIQNGEESGVVKRWWPKW